jgi:hypothetical protein
MKRLHKLFLGFAGIAFLIVWSSASVAKGCIMFVNARDTNGYVECQLSGEDADWCYYQCDCTGDCSGLYDSLGLIDA